MSAVQRRERDQVEDADAEVEVVDEQQYLRRCVASSGDESLTCREAKNGESQKRHEEVRQGPRRGHPGHVASGVTQVGGIHRHRLRPSEPCDDEGDRAEGINVWQRVERDPSQATRGGVAEAVPHERGGGVVEGDRGEEGGGLTNEAGEEKGG